MACGCAAPPIHLREGHDVIGRIMLAVDDTPDSVAAARVAVELVAALRPTLRIVHVSTDHNLDAAVLEAGGQPAVAARRAEADAAIVARACGCRKRHPQPSRTVVPWVPATPPSEMILAWVSSTSLPTRLPPVRVAAPVTPR